MGKRFDVALAKAVAGIPIEEKPVARCSACGGTEIVVFMESDLVVCANCHGADEFE